MKISHIGLMKSLNVRNRFKVSFHPDKPDTLIICNKVWDAQVDLPMSCIQDEKFDLPNWYNDQIPRIMETWVLSDSFDLYDENDDRCQTHPIPNPALNIRRRMMPSLSPILELNGVQVPQGTYPAVQ